jgi:phosphoserine phosphatase
MKTQLFLSDFDGTLVNRDILDVVCGIKGKEEESHKLNMEFIQGKREGLPTLKQRIDFLKGVSLEEIYSILKKDPFLIEGAKELFTYLKSNGYITVLHSGNLVPVLSFYQDYLGIDYIIGTTPRMSGNIIQGVEIEDFLSRNFKVDGCQKIIDKYNVDKKDIIAIGDSPSDLGVFQLAGTTIAINAKGGIEKNATYSISEDLKEVITLLSNRIFSNENK